MNAHGLVLSAWSIDSMVPLMTDLSRGVSAMRSNAFVHKGSMERTVTGTEVSQGRVWRFLRTRDAIRRAVSKA